LLSSIRFGHPTVTKKLVFFFFLNECKSVWRYEGAYAPKVQEAIGRIQVKNLSAGSFYFVLDNFSKLKDN
jgi:hypothetical protein